MYLQAKEHRGLPAMPEAGRGREDPPLDRADTVISDCQPPELPGNTLPSLSFTRAKSGQRHECLPTDG